MTCDAAAYRALGLEPGADQAAIDHAYRALIKRYHPDRQGGDTARASAINEAYFRLRRPAEQPVHRSGRVSVDEAIYARHASRSRRLRHKKRMRIRPVMATAVVLLVFIQREKLAMVFDDVRARVQRIIEPSSLEGTDVTGSSRHPSPELPVSARPVEEAVGLATKLYHSRKQDVLVERTRACHQELRARPTFERFDSCVAFDHAVLELQRRDPLSEEGPFSATAVTARQIGGATLLSHDYLAIETRLDDVRSRVQLLLDPPDPSPDPERSTGPQISP